jgi:hypothetical protein
VVECLPSILSPEFYSKHLKKKKKYIVESKISSHLVINNFIFMFFLLRIQITHISHCKVVYY